MCLPRLNPKLVKLSGENPPGEIMKLWWMANLYNIFRLVDAAQYLSRLRKTIESRRQKDDEEKTIKNKNEQKTSDNGGKQSYFQVEISKRHSGGSEAYSVIEDAADDD